MMWKLSRTCTILGPTKFLSETISITTELSKRTASKKLTEAVYDLLSIDSYGLTAKFVVNLRYNSYLAPSI